MKQFKVIVSMTCLYTIEAEDEDQAERLAASKTPPEADDVEIVTVDVLGEVN